ncbi:MAG: RICIN domain-containing protein [Oscillospiraceae bacterium]|nr:RICIN domain-containing protein [Oscillospiraceae bacterium]
MNAKRYSAFLQLMCILLSLVLAITVMLPEFARHSGLSAAAASVDYPAQLMNLASKNNASVLTETGTADGSALVMKALGSDLSCTWRFDRVGTESTGTYFKLTNVQSGRMLTPNGYKVTAGNDVILYGSESAKSQHWFVVPVSKDKKNNNLTYKIVNYEDRELALTQGEKGMTLSKYTGADNQQFLLNCDGLQGFAGYCKNDNTNNIKAGNIGGLFGEVVEVTNFSDLKKYAEADQPYTIIIKNDIDGGKNYKTDGQNHLYNPDGRIYVTDNKTIVGSYGKHKLYNVALCTKQGSGKGNNVILRNLEMDHDANANGNDNIVVYFGAGQNLWVDHVTFDGHQDYNKAANGQPDYDKFLACCYDADYCTVSDCSFGLHEYGLILGYPDDTQAVKDKYDNYPRMTLTSNKFYKTLTRGPGLMRWGYFHSLNNYVDTFSMAYTVHSGCDIFAENCYYANGGNVICDWNQITFPGAFYETGSKSSNAQRTVRGQGTANNPSYSVESKWRPANNYDYKGISADQAKSYCNAYSGCQSMNTNWMYLRYSKAGVPSAGYSEAPSGPMGPVKPAAASFAEGAAYRIKNVNSGLYLQVDGAAAENNTNVQQWGTDGSSVHDIWKTYSAGDGYYYLISCVGDGGTYALDVAGKKTANGTNVDIYRFNGGQNQQFMIGDKGDGSYTIMTRITGEGSAVEVSGADKTPGANVQQWELNGETCQDWIFEPVSDPGCKMDESLIYTFRNVNSSLVMDINAGKMEAGTNVQQWEQNGFDCQKWTLTAFASGNYYWIRSAQDDAYALKAEGSAKGSNVDLAAYDSKDSAQLFRFTRNPDGTYSILSHASKDICYVEVDAASKDNGASVQQYTATNSPCQKWELLTEAKPVPTEPPTEEPTETTAEETKPQPVMGDIDADGSVTVLDIVALQKYVLNMRSFTQEEFDIADMNGDGFVDVFDLALLRRAMQ